MTLHSWTVIVCKQLLYLGVWTPEATLLSMPLNIFFIVWECYMCLDQIHIHCFLSSSSLSPPPHFPPSSLCSFKPTESIGLALFSSCLGNHYWVHVWCNSPAISMRCLFPILQFLYSPVPILHNVPWPIGWNEIDVLCILALTYIEVTWAGHQHFHLIFWVFWKQHCSLKLNNSVQTYF